MESVLWVLADIVWGGGYCIWKRVSFPRSFTFIFVFLLWSWSSLCVVLALPFPSFTVAFTHLYTRDTSHKIASEPRKILETRKRFLETAFTAAQKAEAEVQRLLNALLQVSRRATTAAAAEDCVALALCCNLSTLHPPSHRTAKFLTLFCSCSCRWKMAGSMRSF